MNAVNKKNHNQNNGSAPKATTGCEKLDADNRMNIANPE